VVGEGKWDPEGFVRLCQEEAVTLTSLVPAQVVDLVRLGLEAPVGLRAVLVGGGALQAGIKRQARDLGWPLLVSYGASEAGSQVATERLSGGEASEGMEGMEVLPHWEARVVGSDGSVLLEGAEGLLELRGQALARRRFVRSGGGWEVRELPDADGWWRTSDRVILSGRRLQFAGRVDRVVKVLGELVNLEAVERQLVEAGLPAGAFVVVAVPEPRRGVELVFVREIVPSNSVPGLTMEDWAAALKRYEATAAPFARLGRQVEVEQLPRSALGKIRYAEVAALIAERGVRG
jgi:o-succinylbenzoate---CoA ligase